MPFLPEKISFMSQARYERIALKGNINFSVGAFGIQTLVIPHNLGYVPYIKGFYTFGDGKFFRLFSGNASFGIDGNGGQVDNESVDTVNYTIAISEQLGGSVAGTVYYRIYAEQLA